VVGLVAAELVLAASANPVSRLPTEALAKWPVQGAQASAFELFLDRLEAAESGGRRYAKNPRSTALGPYQFIESTFLDIARRHFPDQIAGLTEAEILALRTNPHVARNAAAIFCQASAAYLADRGFQPTFAHLRLAYLLGPAGAARILGASPEAQVAKVLPAAVIAANPFMRGWRVADLTAKAERDISPEMRAQAASDAATSPARPPARTKSAAARAKPRLAGSKRCNDKLASCRRFLALRGRSRGGA